MLKAIGIPNSRSHVLTSYCALEWYVLKYSFYHDSAVSRFLIGWCAVVNKSPHNDTDAILTNQIARKLYRQRLLFPSVSLCNATQQTSIANLLTYDKKQISSDLPWCLPRLTSLHEQRRLLYRACAKFHCWTLEKPRERIWQCLVLFVSKIKSGAHKDPLCQIGRKFMEQKFLDRITLNKRFSCFLAAWSLFRVQSVCRTDFLMFWRYTTRLSGYCLANFFLSSSQAVENCAANIVNLPSLMHICRVIAETFVSLRDMGIPRYWCLCVS